MNAPWLPPIQIPKFPPQQALYQNISAPPPNQFFPTPPAQNFLRPVAERLEILRREEERRKQVEQDKLNTEKLLDVTENTNPPPSSILRSEPPIPRPSIVLPLSRPTFPPPRPNVAPLIPNFDPRMFSSLAENVPPIPNLRITPLTSNITHLGTASPTVVAAAPTFFAASPSPVVDAPTRPSTHPPIVAASPSLPGVNSPSVVDAPPAVSTPPRHNVPILDLPLLYLPI